MEYRIQEGRFDLPEGLHDQTVNVFTATPSGPSPFNVVITRTRAEPDLSLAEHVTRELDAMRGALVGFEHLWRRPWEVDGRPAEIAAARVGGGGDGGEEAMDQRQVFTLHDGRALTFTASARGSFSAEQLEALNALFGSLRFA